MQGMAQELTLYATVCMKGPLLPSCLILYTSQQRRTLLCAHKALCKAIIVILIAVFVKYTSFIFLLLHILNCRMCCDY